MTIEQIKQECRKAIELAEKATEGPWVTGSIPWKVWADRGYKTICHVRSAGDEVPVGLGLSISESMGANRDHIANARTFAPAAARALLLAIEQLEDMQKGFMCSQSRDALDAICAQFEPCSG